VNVGDEVTITPTELVAGGAALARIDGLPLFAADLYPGDRARVRVTEVKKGFVRGETVELLEPSPLRRLEPCPIAEECGGCDWTALRLDAQLKAKERILTESLRRIGKIDTATLPPISIHPSPLNYRIRSRLHREGDAVGFFAMRSNRIVQLATECEVVGVETARKFGVPGGGRLGSGERDTTAIAANEFSVWEVDGEIIRNTRDLEMKAGKFKFALSTDAFFQVNRHLLTTMMDLVTRHAERCSPARTAIDLYSGIGFFTAALARRFARVTAVEGSRISARYGRRNAAANVRTIHAPVEEWVEKMPRADLVFLDPPRSGTRKNVIERIADRTGSMICFLACDPVTFARDASRLIASGWRLSTLDLLDLFPNTHHVETLSSFERAS
jgi:tRNA/tmRNA/rRNA uracil-C5-methylase (TrmA/RlmC/RlmD family)